MRYALCTKKFKMYFPSITTTSYSLADAAGQLFDNITIVSIVFLVAGMILLFIEMHRDFNHVLSLLGTLLLLAGIILTQVNSFSFGSLFILLTIIIPPLIVNHLLVLYFQKRLWLYQSIRRAVGEDNPSSQSALQSLIGTAALAISNLDLMGTIAIGEHTFFAKSYSVIAMGRKVIIKDIEGDIVIVEEIKTNTIKE